MSTEKLLYLRTGARLKVLELVKVEQQMRDKDVLGRGDVVTLHFKNSAKETARMVGLVTEAVIDEDGGYPVIAMDMELTYTSASGKPTVDRGLVAHDMCL